MLSYVCWKLLNAGVTHAAAAAAADDDDDDDDDVYR